MTDLSKPDPTTAQAPVVWPTTLPTYLDPPRRQGDTADWVIVLSVLGLGTFLSLTGLWFLVAPVVLVWFVIAQLSS